MRISVPSRLLPALALLAIGAVGVPPAAIAQISDDSAAPGTPGDSVEGYWSGYVKCGKKGWAVFHHITGADARLESNYTFFGGNAGQAAVDIFQSGDVLLFDAEPNNVYDYEYTRVGDELIGRGRSEECTTRLRPISEADYTASQQ